MTLPCLTAIVVAWNSGAALEACLGSLRASAHLAGLPIQVVVVDNGSRDEAVARLQLEEHDAVVINPMNAGYAVAVAQGLAHSTAPWILLVNPDVVVEQGFASSLMHAAESAAPNVATLVPELRFAARPNLVNCRGLAVDEIGVPAEIDAGAPVAERQCPSLPVLGGSSGCCLLRRELLNDLGGPEPLFFAYLEDVDLALRLNDAGYAALFVPNAIAFHEGSASTGAQSPLKVHLVARNRRLLFRLHGPRDLQATAWRALVDVAHGAYATIATPLAPWIGRFEALRYRRYVRFLRRCRADVPDTGSYSRPPRANLRNTLERKRRILSKGQ